jgi:sRNA-binding protein
MTRTILSIGSALFAAATLFTSAAEACISCEYTPEVVQAHTTSRPEGNYQKQRAEYAAKALAASLAKQRAAAAAKAQLMARKMEAAKAARAEAMKAAEIETKPAKEIKTVASEQPAAAEKPATSEKAPVAETKVAQDVGCKKFISAIGTTVTVPCE